MDHLSAPYLSPLTHTGRMMWQVLLALIPGIAAMTWIFGYGIIINTILAILSALVMEAAMLAIRRKPVICTLKDNSAMVTAVLLALSIPPLTSWWVIVIGILFAIVVSKHLYGGLGFNVFNPAMAGYAVLMISFPVQMTLWPDPDLPHLSFSDVFNWQIFHQLPASGSLDAVTGATPLDALRTAKRVTPDVVNLDELSAIQVHMWILNSVWLIGGCWLVYQRITSWLLPTVFLFSLTALTTAYWLVYPDKQPAPLFFLLHGSAIMAAFFILTDPVTAPITDKGKVIAAILVAVLVFVIRNWGGYPEGIAFAVLLMNLTVPLIDRYT